MLVVLNQSSVQCRIFSSRFKVCAVQTRRRLRGACQVSRSGDSALHGPETPGRPETPGLAHRRLRPFWSKYDLDVYMLILFVFLDMCAYLHATPLLYISQVGLVVAPKPLPLSMARILDSKLAKHATITVSPRKRLCLCQRTEERVQLQSEMMR